MEKEKVPHLHSERIEATDEFISKNKFKLKNQEEIIEKLKSIRYDDVMFDFRPEVLVNHLSLENGKEYLDEEYLEKVEKKEIEYVYISDVKETVQDFLDYMNFAWDKALDERGLSASRSISKLGAWLWLLNREDLMDMITNDDLYNPYGSPALIAVCNELGIKVPDELIEFSNNKC